MNMVFCKVCGLWIADKSAWENGEPGYCEKCKPPSFIKKTLNNILRMIRSTFTRNNKKI